ncbi:peptidoglycan-associated lipoprotein [Methylomarinovum tepidoasis]|uniref:Peptidoglycan-associated lipoprotein n=1 Tax=Methylomarinovum tepidoasis TaxID=2840183 RepID=A0AAU9CWC0_9GAMM|nr:peptidoglycan-associated lipoprotein Pal [Methylomarinovum sp. IN45]BCX88454.1 peptidoglycan-associated lipoprotein [Methylomarinovum sp. IN45]
MKRWLGLGLVLALAGCKTLTGNDQESQAGARAAGAQAEAAHTQGLAGEEGATLYEVQSGVSEGAGPGADAGALLQRRTLYFDFDSAQVRPEDVPVVQAHARYLVDHPQLQVTLEGHTDERGSREYNVALGEARAKAVARLLELNGVPAQRIHVVSYGEEKPVALGHDETAWAKNRRVEIVYGR